MVTAVSNTFNNSKTTSQNRTRIRLLTSEPDNAPANRRPKSREVTSRFLSSSSSSSSSTSSMTSKRCPSPLVSRTISSTAMMTPPVPSSHSTIKRSQSVEQRRSVTPRPNSNNSSLDLRKGEISAAKKMLFTSTRSFSVSFQGESVSLQGSLTKPALSPSPIITVRKGTPEKRKAITPARGTVDHTENSKPELWPGRLRRLNSMSRSVDYTDEKKKLSGGSRGNVVRVIQNSMVDNNNNRALFETRLSTDSANALLERIQMQKKKENVVNESDVRFDLTVSDTESVSSGSNSEAHESHGVVNQWQRGPRGIAVPARFWHETNNRLRRQTDPGSHESKNNGLKNASTAKLGVTKKFGIDSSVSSPKGVVNTKGQVSPIRGAIRPASPGNLATSATSSPVRGVSPSRIRNLVGVGVSSNLNNVNNTLSILSFAADVRRGKIRENGVVDAHFLRLFYNRLLQWRFVNARADAALSAQRFNAERSLYNTWITMSKLCESVKAKRTKLQLLRQNLKLTSILKGQMMYLEESSHMEWDYSNSLLAVIEALRASTLCLPIVGGARADVQNVKDAISSAVNVMQAMASSICLLLSKAAEVNSLVTELSNVSAKEHALLGHCNDLLSAIAAMQVKEFTMRTHILQLEQRVPSSLTTKV
ncbi:QWRF motif-containing protein 2-like [Mangifera indica]|uniref:QWRF motif-containing protein 2-like n=1 Tax=Mangifera indica TaxID=29780 RepID=UPI001CFB76FF|nr:QWRF motif-containing protein 2-like [Mangifera indica]